MSPSDIVFWLFLGGPALLIVWTITFLSIRGMWRHHR